MASSKIATAYVQIAPSMDGVASEVKQYFGDAGNTSGSSFGSNLVGKIKTLIATAGLGKVLTDTIMTGSDLQQLAGGVQKIFDGMDTATIMADAANAYKDLNMSANQYLAVINDVGAAFAANMGDEKGYSVAKTGLQAISDYASGTGKNVDELSQKFTMITRSTSSYQSIADQFSGILPATSAGFLEQAQAAGLLSGEYKKLTDVPIEEYQQAVSEMLKKGTAELGLAGNTAAEAATTFSGSLAAMKSMFSNLLGNLALGEDIGPSLMALGDTVYTFLVGNLIPMVGNILSSLPEVLGSLFSMAIQSLNLAADNADSILANGIGLVTALRGAIISALPQMAEAALNLVASMADGLLNNLPTPVDSMGTILADLLQAVLDAAPTILDNGIELIGSLSEGLSNNAPAVMESIGDILAKLIGMLANALPDLLSKGVELIGSMATGLLNNLPAVLSSIGSIIAKLLSTIASHLPDLLAQGISLIGQLAAGLIKAIPQVVAAIPQIISNIVNTFKGWNWGEIGSNIVSGIANGITAGAGAIWQAAKNAASNALKAAKNLLGIASPSKVMRDEVGKFIPAGIAVGIEANADDVTNAVSDLSDMTTATLQSDLLMDVPGSSMASSAATKTYGDTHITINVYGAEGQDIHELAKLVMEEAQYEFDRRAAALV